MQLVQSFSNAGAVTTVRGVPVRAVLLVDAAGNAQSTTATVAIEAGTTTDTVVKPSAGRLGRVLVTATGTDEVSIYDSADAASGTRIGIVPADAPPGRVCTFDVAAANGIVIGGSSALPGVTISYS
jgi:hypothetical protein